MSEPLVEEWIEKAEEDYETAGFSIRDPRGDSQQVSVFMRSRVLKNI